MLNRIIRLFRKPTEEQIEARKALDILVERVMKGDFKFINDSYGGDLYFDDIKIDREGRVWHKEEGVFTYPYECIKPEYQKRVWNVAFKVTIILLNRKHRNKVINGSLKNNE